MRRISFFKGNRSDNLLHIETEGCIINVRIGLSDTSGHDVTNVEIIPDKMMGEEYDIDGDPTIQGQNIRLLRRK